MGVPNTNTFDLGDVTDELGLGSGDSLQDCFNDSSAGDFDDDYNPNSDGSSNNLLNFRNYNGGSALVLEVISTSSGFPPNGVILIWNRSVLSQTITYTWQYVSQSNPGVDPDATVQLGYGGTTVAVGYTTPAITTSLSDDNYAFHYYDSFYISGGNGVTLTFKFVLLTAATDTVPSSPDNEGFDSICINCV
tara:strand:+ start:57 stop:629 length:573 start_codon:yes stop_codon:yes gene_type:complete